MANWKDDVRSLVFEYVEENWLTHGEALVLIRLADYADWKTGLNARPGSPTLARQLSMSVDTVGNALKRGQDLDLIALTRRGGGTGSSKKASNYRFVSDLLPGSTPPRKNSSNAPGSSKRASHVTPEAKTSPVTAGRTSRRSSDRTSGKTSRGTSGRTEGNRGQLPSTPKTPKSPGTPKTPKTPNDPNNSISIGGMTFSSDEWEAMSKEEKEAWEEIERELLEEERRILELQQANATRDNRRKTLTRSSQLDDDDEDEDEDEDDDD